MLTAKDPAAAGSLVSLTLVPNQPRLCQSEIGEGGKGLKLSLSFATESSARRDLSWPRSCDRVLALLSIFLQSSPGQVFC